MAIYSSQRRCQDAINELWKFTAHKTREELTTGSSMRIVTHLRSNLISLCNEMDLAHRNHDPGAGNEYNTASLRVNMIVKSTKDDIGQVLMELDDKLAQPTVRTFTPPGQGHRQEPHTLADQLHPVRTPPSSNPPRTQRTLHTGGRPHHVTQAIATRQHDVRIAHQTPAQGPGIDYRRQPETEPTLARPMMRQTHQLTQQAPTGRSNSDILLKRSTATPAARTPGETRHRSTQDYSIGAAGNNATDRNSPGYGDILKCHTCKVWGTWPLIQAHYRDNHGYTPQRNSRPSPPSSPEPAQPRKKYNKHTSAPDETGAQQNRNHANQSDSNVGSTRAGYSEQGRQTENTPPPHTHRVKTMAERKIYESNIEPMKTSTNIYRKSQNTRLQRSTKAVQPRQNDTAPTVTDGEAATTIQRLGSLNFPPINPRNATEAYDGEEAQQKEIVTLEVTDIPMERRDEETVKDKHENNEPSTENSVDAHISGELYGGEPIVKPTTLERASNPTPEHDSTELTHTKPDPKLSRKSGSLWDSVGALAALARGISGMAKTPEIDAPQTSSGKSKMGPETTPAPENSRTNNGSKREPRGTTDRHVPRQISEQVQLAGRQMASKCAEYNAQPPREDLYDANARNIRIEVRTAADPEKAICEAILFGKVDATGSYNVDGHAESIEDLQERLRDLQAQKIAKLHSTTRPTE